MSSDIVADVSVGRGVLLHDHLILEPGVTIEDGVIFARPEDEGKTTLRSGVRVGAGAVVGADIEIGWNARIEPGSVVLASVPPNAVVQGNPARIVGYTGEAVERWDTTRPTTAQVPDKVDRATARSLNVGGAALYRMPRINDLRGSLSVGELGSGFPFVPQRYFVVFDVPSEELRGEHAHRECHQFLLCVHGSCRALVDDGIDRSEVILDQPDIGLYMPPMIWGTQYRYTQDAVLLVFASHPYDGADYIRTYDVFRQECVRGQR